MGESLQLQLTMYMVVDVVKMLFKSFQFHPTLSQIGTNWSNSQQIFA